MSTTKISRIKSSEQARSIPLADVQLTWMAEDFAGRGKPRTIDGATLARLLHHVPDTPRSADDGYLATHLDGLRALMAALTESRFEMDGAETAPYIFGMLAQYIAWLKLEEQWGDEGKIKAVLGSATVTIGATAEEAPE